MAAPLEVTVDGIGVFTFRHRALRDQFRIEGEASRLLGGPVDDPLLRAGAVAFATLAVLTITAPDGWNLDTLDPFDPSGSAGRLFQVHGALREAEDRFRHPAAS
jgi:hypothetical protein